MTLNLFLPPVPTYLSQQNARKLLLPTDVQDPDLILGLGLLRAMAAPKRACRVPGDLPLPCFSSPHKCTAVFSAKESLTPMTSVHYVRTQNLPTTFFLPCSLVLRLCFPASLNSFFPLQLAGLFAETKETGFLLDQDEQVSDPLSLGSYFYPILPPFFPRAFVSASGLLEFSPIPLVVRAFFLSNGFCRTSPAAFRVLSSPFLHNVAIRI